MARTADKIVYSLKQQKISEISGSHGGEYAVYSLLGCTAV
jgi:hypothetical protein